MTTGIGWPFAAVSLPPSQYIVVAGADLEPMDEELEFLRSILLYLVPIALAIAGVGGWFLARQSLSPVVAMADAGEAHRRREPERAPARRQSARRAGTPGRDVQRAAGPARGLAVQQRQFMADASHELRTPVATTRTAASVALQQAHRDEREYREALEIVEQQAARLRGSWTTCSPWRGPTRATTRCA